MDVLGHCESEEQKLPNICLQGAHGLGTSGLKQH